MAIRFVDKTPATTETDAPADHAIQPPQEPVADPEAAEGEPPAPPRPARRRRKADAPASTGPEGDAAPDSQASGEPAATSAALPGFEDRPKPKRRRGAARPYWGFG